MAAIRSYKSLGVDLGKERDPPVAVELSQSEGELMKLLTNCAQFPLGIKWPDLSEVLVACGDSADIVLVDANGLGSVLIDYMRQKHNNVWGVITTAGKAKTPHIEVSEKKIYVPKAVMVEQLVVDVERARLEVLQVGAYKTLLEEMKQFQAKQGGRSTTIKYEAKSGKHDDLVMALAMARMGFAALDIQRALEGERDAEKS